MLTLVRCGGGSVRTRKRVYPFEVAPTASELGNPELCPEGFSPEPPGAWAKRVRREREGLLVPALPSRLSTRAATCGRQVDGLQQQLLQQPQAERGYEAPDNGHPNNDSRQAKEHSFRISRFLEMCHRHEGTRTGKGKRVSQVLTLVLVCEDFIKNSVVIDSYLLAMASLYLKRAGLNAKGYTKDRYFFYALYLAIGAFLDVAEHFWRAMLTLEQRRRRTCREVLRRSSSISSVPAGWQDPRASPLSKYNGRRDSTDF